ncbi:hypothetical protein N9L56_01605 [Gammaproteobacteria bacterium]|nr:hypothetical protein [Gammaproteobacteria bacterium]
MKAKNKFSQLYLPLLFLTIDSANASEECGKINDDYKRLDCYDALYKDNPIAKTNVISDFREIENSKDQTQDSTKIKNSPKVVATIKSADSSKTKIMDIFSTAKSEEKPKLDEKKQITYVITKVKITPDGKYIIYSDKLRFKLNDYIKKSFRPKPGVKFTIRESSFGGYRIKFEGLNREYRIKS